STSGSGTRSSSIVDAKTQPFFCPHGRFAAQYHSAGVLNRSGSSGVLVTLSLWTKSLAPQGEIFHSPASAKKKIL
ncbi:MAG: hypothetical protein II079_08480, partial [Oscillospiraceae bacterium]|nr:hypothetical protein [Oscillospiraceae bacterium]